MHLALFVDYETPGCLNVEVHLDIAVKPGGLVAECLHLPTPPIMLESDTGSGSPVY